MEWGLAVTDMALTLTAADGAEEVGGVGDDGGGRGMGQQSSAVLKEAADVPVGPLSIDTSATTFFLPVGLDDTTPRAVSLTSDSRPPPLPEAEASGAAAAGVVPLALLMMVGTLRWYLDTHSLSRRSMAAARRLSSAYLVSQASNSKL